MKTLFWRNNYVFITLCICRDYSDQWFRVRRHMHIQFVISIVCWHREINDFESCGDKLSSVETSIRTRSSQTPTPQQSRLWYFDPNEVEICSQGSNWQTASTGLGNGFAMNRQQAITWTNNGKFPGLRRDKIRYYDILNCVVLWIKFY